MCIKQVSFHSPKLNTSLLVPFSIILPLYKPYNPLGLIFMAVEVFFFDIDFLFLETLFNVDAFFVAIVVKVK